MRNVFIYSTILALSLGGAWFRWTKAPDPATGEEVIIFQGAADDIDQIVWTSDEEAALYQLNRIHTVNTSGLSIQTIDHKPIPTALNQS